MPGRDKGGLTEPMYYVLMSFLHGEMCGIEITDFVAQKTAGRVCFQNAPGGFWIIPAFAPILPFFSCIISPSRQILGIHPFKRRLSR